jgi:chemotaxis protein CheX
MNSSQPLAQSLSQAVESGVGGTFETLFGVTPAIAVAPEGQAPRPGEANVMLGFSGDMSGQLMLGMTEDAACRLAGTLLMQDMAAFDEVVRSGVAELGNMVAGGLATAFAQQGVQLNITVPTVLSGRDVHVSWPGLAVCAYTIALPFATLRLALGIKPGAR